MTPYNGKATPQKKKKSPAHSVSGFSLFKHFK